MAYDWTLSELLLELQILIFVWIIKVRLVHFQIRIERKMINFSILDAFCARKKEKSWGRDMKFYRFCVIFRINDASLHNFTDILLHFHRHSLQSSIFV
jgi:hypothetical protein